MFTRLIPFQFDSRDALVLVLTDSTMQFIKNGAPILVLGVPYSIATPYAGADLATIEYVQEGNLVTLVHPSYPPQELTRIADNNWTIAAKVFGAKILAPAGIPVITAYLVSMTPDLFGWVFVITSIGADGEESLQSVSIGVSNVGHHNHPIVVTWTAATGAASYRVYRRPPQQTGTDVGAFGFVGVASTNQFVDYGADPDFTQQPPIAQTPFGSANNYPSAIGYYQQRMVLANTNNNPDTVWASQTGRRNNFNISVPVKDDDALTFRVVSDTVDAIRHVLAQGILTLLTEGGEWPVYGDYYGGVLTPATINARRLSSHGVGLVRPIPAGGRLLFPQALGSTVLELDAQSARDLTLFSTHLFDGHQIVDMAWQQEPSHVAWFVRDDGVLLGLTYVADQDVLAWHRHDLQGLVESVCVVPEVVGLRIEHRVYVGVARVFGGSLDHTVECFASPVFDAVDEEAWFVDGAVEYDGRFTLVPASTVSGLDHLDGLTVAVYAFGKIVGGVSDGIGYVVANPLRADLATITVVAGAIVLPDEYLRIVVGLPFISDLETLDLDTAEGPTLKTQKTNVNKVGVQLIDSRNIWAGPRLPDDATPTDKLRPFTRMADPAVNALVSDFVEQNVQGQWNTNGRIGLRSLDPTPLTVLSIVPEGHFPSAGGA